MDRLWTRSVSTLSSRKRPARQPPPSALLPLSPSSVPLTLTPPSAQAPRHHARDPWRPRRPRPYLTKTDNLRLGRDRAPVEKATSGRVGADERDVVRIVF